MKTNIKALAEASGQTYDYVQQMLREKRIPRPENWSGYSQSTFDRLVVMLKGIKKRKYQRK